MEFDKLDYDVFVAGSGPLGSTYARLILEHHKSAKVLMVEVGAQESATIGSNLKNAIKRKDLDAFCHIIRGAMQPTSIPSMGGHLPGLQGDAWIQRESRPSINSPYNPDQDPTANLDAGGSVTRTVGGMSTHWTCACPEPHDEELELCPIERNTMRGLLQRAKKLLNVHDNQFENSLRHQLVKKTLSDALASQGRIVKSLDLAGERSKANPEYITWSGADTVLGDSINLKDDQGGNRFRLLTECLVVKFVLEGDNKVAGALVRDLRTGTEHIVKAKARSFSVFVAACGLVCTPQLLWNSNIRHKALGRYLTGQSHTFCQIVLRRTLIDSLRAPDSDEQGDSANTLPIPLNDPDPQITIPYSSEYPYHTQLHRDAFSYGDVGPQIDHRVVLDLRFFGRGEVRESNYVSFSDKDKSGRTNTDVYGMPQPTFHFHRSSEDNRRAQMMMKDMCDVANILGSYLPTALPQFIPQGIHATGTTRVGNDPRTSVADSNSRVRVDEDNLFENLWVGGVSCVPDSTACNPTLTAVAYAIQGANDMIQVIGGNAFLNGSEV
ncbi:Pyranose 2-oxidase [Ceratobasidium sp. 395]|nr:Pyranose 2-oxidase [Ceratobasidium sp. 395]